MFGNLAKKENSNEIPDTTALSLTTNAGITLEEFNEQQDYQRKALDLLTQIDKAEVESLRKAPLTDQEEEEKQAEFGDILESLSAAKARYQAKKSGQNLE